MRIGLSIASHHRVKNVRDGARYMIERASYARQAELDSLFVGDHHVTDQPYYQNTPMLGRLLAEWPDKPVGALYLLPLWHPVLLAEQIATLATITDSPFIMQCGLGADAKQAAGMGTQLKHRARMFESALSLMQALWRGETVSEERYWQIDNARISPQPPEPIEVWVGSVAPAAINRTARMAEGWLASPGLTPEQASDALNQYRQACAEHQRTPTATAIRRDIFIGATEESARKTVEPYIQRGYRGMDPRALIFGSVDSVAAQILDLKQRGFSDVIVRNLSSDQNEALATIERIGEVARQLKNASDLSDADTQETP